MKNNRLQGIIGTVVVHLIILLILFVVTLHAATPEEESGVPVMLGSAELSQGDADPYTLTEVDVLDELQPETAPTDPSVETPSEQEMLTQDLEETVVMKPQKKPVKPKTEVKTPPKKQPEQPKQPTKTPEQIAAEKRAAAEKAAAEEAAKKIAGAFGKGSSMGNRGTGTTGSGVQGSPTGNSNTGKSTGVGGVGSWDLNGRSLTGSLPIPVYNVQDEGRVVVTIVVNPSGRVISTSINKRTNTVSTALRRAAEEAARKARFNVTDGVNNQGEIAPVTAAEIAKTFGIRVYTIGVGTMGKAPYPFQTAFGVQYQNIDVEIDEPTLKQIAATTGGQYFRATDNASLKEIYSEIDQMEKTKISVQQYSKKQEEYKNWAILLFALLLVEIVIRNTLVRNIP